MSVVLRPDQQRFPIGTSVGAYLRSAWTPGGVPEGPPTGAAVESQAIAADGTLTFTTLPVETQFYAYALVGGAHRIFAFRDSVSYYDRVRATAGLLSYYRMAELRGTTAIDEKAVANGAYAGAVDLGSRGWRPGRRAPAFKGAGSLSAPMNLSAFSVITVEFWLNWAAYANDGASAVELTANGGLAEDGFWMQPNGSTGKWEVGMHSTAGGFNVTFFNRPPAGVYHHFAVILDRSKADAAGSAVVYMDGSQQTPTSTNGGGAVLGNFANSTLNVMARNAVSNFGTGSIGELAIYSGALSASTIASHAASR